MDGRERAAHQPKTTLRGVLGGMPGVSGKLGQGAHRRKDGSHYRASFVRHCGILIWRKDGSVTSNEKRQGEGAI